MSHPARADQGRAIDGAGFLRIFWRLVLRCSPPRSDGHGDLAGSHTFWTEFLRRVTLPPAAAAGVTAALIACAAVADIQHRTGAERCG